MSWVSLASLAACVPRGRSGDVDLMHDYDATGAVDAREIAREQRQGATIIDLSFASPRGGRVPAYLVLPGGKGPFPAVLFGHWMMEGSPLRDRREFLEEALVLARAGAAALLTDAPAVRAGSPVATGELQSMELDAGAARQQVADFRRAIDLLVERGDIDATRIAFVGHSFNAHVGGILSAVEKRIGSFALMAGAFADERYVFNPDNAQMVAFRRRVGDAALRDFYRRHAWDDPVNFVGRSAPAAVFLQFGARDEPIPVPLAREYYELFGRPKRMELYDAGHALDAAARRDRVAWLAQRLGLGPIDVAALDRIPPLK
jgi:dienelactone hydrolase